jgi:large subunit ribosomal protein L11
MILPVLVTFFSDKSFTFEIKSPPASILLLKAAGLEKGSSASHRDKVGKVNRAQLAEIAKIKMQDLNCTSEDSAISMIAGTARSMGITVDG